MCALNSNIVGREHQAICFTSGKELAEIGCLLDFKLYEFLE